MKIVEVECGAQLFLGRVFGHDFKVSHAVGIRQSMPAGVPVVLDFPWSGHVMNACPFILGVAVSLCFIHSLSGCNFIIVIGCLGGPYPNLWWQCPMPWLYQGFSPQLHLQSGAGSTLIPVSMCQGLVTQLVDSIGISSREPRLIFTAGAMGVGKSHVIRWMKEKDLLPLHDFAAGLHKPVIFCQKPSRIFLSFSELFPAQPRRRQCDDRFFSSAAKSRSSGLHQS